VAVVLWSVSQDRVSTKAHGHWHALARRVTVARARAIVVDLRVKAQSAVVKDLEAV